MGNVIQFSDYAGRKPSGKKPKTSGLMPLVPARCDQVKMLVVGKHVTDVLCIDEENFTLMFDNGAKLNLMIAIENDLMEVINIIKQKNSEDE
jgi:hypothetical protein